MTNVAVVAHARKSFGGGLPELRTVLADEGVTDPLWHEVRKSKHAPDSARRAVEEGADLIFVWGGDGTVQRCIDALAGTDAVMAILPAGTANLLASNLGVPAGDVAAAVRVGLHGRRRPLDTGTVNGEHFAVIAGAGFDARMIADADRGMKDRLGRVAYLYAGAKNLSARAVEATVEVDGEPFFQGLMSCVLAGNVGKVTGGIEAFAGAQPDDGLLELGVITATSLAEWARTFGELVLGRAERSPFVAITRGKKFRIRFASKLPYELDGGARGKLRQMRIEVEPRSITVCVPSDPV
jgi:diacylglycerol kinase (ATP)